jgi:putative membrane protein
MMWGYGFSWGRMFLMVLSTTLWIALLMIFASALIRWLNRKATTSVPPITSGPSSIEILRQRYGRGEIDTTTFERMPARLVASNGYSYQHDNLSFPALPQIDSTLAILSGVASNLNEHLKESLR